MSLLSDSKTIWRFLRKYKGKAYFISFIAVIGAAIVAIIPYLYGSLVDIAIQPNSSWKILGGILLAWLIFVFFKDWMKRITFLQGAYIATDASNDFLVEVSEHLIDLPISYHKHQKMGEIIQRMYRGGDFLDMIIVNVVFSTLPSFLSVIGALIIMTLVEWRLMVLVAVMLFFYGLSTIWKTNNIVDAQKKLNKTCEKVYGDVYDMIINIQTVKSFTNEKLEKRKTSNNFKKKAGGDSKNLMFFWKNLQFWQGMTLGLGFVFVFAAAISFLKMNLISAGELVMFVGYINLVQEPFKMISQNYRMLRTGIVAIDRSLELLDVEREKYKPENAIILKDIKGNVEFDNVSFSYENDKKIVLKNVSLRVKAGEMIALVGESGVGKSTSVELISGYYFPTKGKLLIDGQDITKIDLYSLRKNIAIVPQEVVLFNDTVKNNIAYGKKDATEKEIRAAAEIAHAHEFIEGFTNKYNQIVGERGIKLSTGQKQRIAIARAVLRNPKILILDEATASLDTETEKFVQEALHSLMKGRTTFVIAHRLSTIQEADKIIVFEKGRIVEEGDHSELIAHGGVYKKLCELQSTVVKG